MEKKCTKCGEVKGLDEFPNRKDGRNGKHSFCKICLKEYKKIKYNKNKVKIKQDSKERYEKNKQRLIKGMKLYNEKNKEKRKEYNKKYRLNNEENIKEKRKEYNFKNKEKIKEQTKEYYEKNKLKIDKQRKEWKIKNKKRTNLYKTIKKQTNPLYKLSCNVSNLIYISLKSKSYDKTTKTYNILKCEFDFFMKWLNGIASNGYTYGVGDLHLDHVVPVSLAQTEDEILLLNHYSNYQLLSADENLRKGNLYVNPTNLKRVLEHHPNPDKIREIHARL